jgi:hypothetical protein
MALVIKELHKAKDADALNEEWLVLENTGPNAITAMGCVLTLARSTNDRPHPLGTLDPGFVLHPNEQIRLVTGSPSKKSQGTPPAEKKDLKNYHLFLKEPMLSKPGSVIAVALKQLELARAVFKPDAKNGIGE